MIEINTQTARAFLLNRSYLGQRLNNLDEYFDKFHCVQVDPLNVVARNQELVLWNRIKGFERDDLEQAMYGKNRSVFEYWLQLYSIIRLKDYPYLSARRSAARNENTFQANFYKTHRNKIEQTLEYVRNTEGAIGAKQIAHIDAAENFLSWGEGKSHKALLEYLWDIGELAISHREGNHKVYDLSENLLPAEVLDKKVSEDESLEFMVKSYFDYLGLVQKSFLSRVGRSIVKSFRQKFEQMLKTDVITEVKIIGLNKKYFVWTAEWAEFQNIMKYNIYPGVSILAPLDPLVIDRDLLHAVFGLFYRWEVYTPAAKRTVGYYNMPILYGEEMIGQIALRKDKSGFLKVENQVLNAQQSKQVQVLIDEQVDNLREFIAQLDKLQV